MQLFKYNGIALIYISMHRCINYTQLLNLQMLTLELFFDIFPKVQFSIVVDILEHIF